jgi:hypothetical protein
MDKINRYRESIKWILTEYKNFARQAPNKKYETCLIFDETHDHYLWMSIAWTDKKGIHHINAHLRIKNDKIYIEQDRTEEGIADELIHLGIPSSEIVLAFQPPDARKYTDFAIA